MAEETAFYRQERQDKGIVFQSDMGGKNEKTILVLYLNRPMRYARYVRYTELLRRRRHENLVFCQHHPVVTMGLQTRPESLLLQPEDFKRHAVDLVKVRRGGDATAHEPGQIVIYPHVDLRARNIRLSDFVKAMLDITSYSLEQVFGLRLHPNPQAPGLYTERGEKVVSSGLEVRSGFSSSGVAVNYSNALKTFSFIHPCGYPGLRMQSVLQLLGRSEKKNDPETDEKKREFCQVWAERFIQSFSLYR